MNAIGQGDRYKVTAGNSATAGTGAGEKPALRDGSVVELEVLGPAKDGGTAIRVGGKNLNAVGIGNLPMGVLIPARVSVENGTVFLRVLASRSDISARATLAELSLPATPLALRLVDSMRLLHLRMDPTRMRNLLRVASRFPGREGEAVEAALILAEAGLDPDDASIGDLLSMIAGDAGDGQNSRGDQRSRDEQNPSDEQRSRGERQRGLAARLNAPNGRDRQWMVYPYEREIAGKRCLGSVRFLIDRTAMTTVETRVFFDDGVRLQRFSLEGDKCGFFATPPFLPAKADDFIVYLSKALSSFGILNVEHRDPEATIGGPSRVDLEA